MPCTRRDFLLSSALLPLLQPAGRVAAVGGALTAGEVVDRIKGHVGIPWRATTVDNLVAGSPDTPVRGVATTMMATLDVLRRAADGGANMVITHESTFYSHQDRIEPFVDDATYKAKTQFIAERGMAVFHFHDHWHGRRPDGIAIGMARAAGWQAQMDPDNPKRFRFDGVPLADLARGLRKQLNIRVMRVIGDPDMPVRNVAASWGNCSLMPGVPYLSDPAVDVLVIGETNEWELVEYVQDQNAAGLKKGLIILGHVVSEQAGMEYCAEWLRTFVTEVPVTFVAAPEPYWSPEQPVRA